MTAQETVQSLVELVNALLENRPYFGRAFFTAQILPSRLPAMRRTVEVIAKRHPGPVHVLEVGSWAGQSAVTWAQAIQDFSPHGGRVLCVDTWRPYENPPSDKSEVYTTMDFALKSGIAYKLYRHNVEASGLGGMITHQRGLSREILPALERGAFDIVFIDASHLYRDVLLDITQAKALVKDGGIICGDDFELSKELADPTSHAGGIAADADLVTDPRLGVQYHPGVTEAVTEAFGTVASYDGYWSVERRGIRFQPLVLL